MDLDFLTEEVKKLARETGEFLKKERLSFDRSRVEQKAAHDYVSYVDKASEKRIVERLHELLPEAGFIAEEFQKIEYDWNTEFHHPPVHLKEPRPWDWMVVGRKFQEPKMPRTKE